MTPSAISSDRILDWPHAPAHRLRDRGVYLVTAGTRGKEHFFHSRERLSYLTNALMVLAQEYGWGLQAWAIFSNHYHFIGGSEKPCTLRRLIQYLHSISAKHINLLDGTPGRTVWFQYWDTQLTHEKSYLARLTYVHTNAVRHGLVGQAEQYPWCSAGWFLRKAGKPFFETVKRFPCDKVMIPDGFKVSNVVALECGSPAPAFEQQKS
jgi:putative transposase